MKKILIVEDELALLNILRDTLNAQGYEVVKARDGQEGLTLAQTQKPDLILLDLLMPVMDGLAMLKTLKASDWGGKIPVIVLSNLGSDTQIKDAAALGVSDYLVKSDWSVEEISQKIKDKIGT